MKSPTAAAANNNWFAYLRLTGFVKVAASFVKHIPQAVLNITRRSTVGFSFTMVCLDTVGGLFSLGQQGIRSLRLGSLAPFTSNIAKTVLAVESLLFDAFFICNISCGTLTVMTMMWFNSTRMITIMSCRNHKNKPHTLRKCNLKNIDDLELQLFKRYR